MERPNQSRFAITLLVVVLALQVSATAHAFSPEEANRYVASKDWNGLLRYDQAWVAAEPANPTAWFYLGNTYGVGLNDYANASRAFERCVELNPQWQQAYNALGSTYAQSHQWAKSAAAYERAVRLSPQTADYWTNLAAAYSHLGRFDLELDALNRGESVAGSYANARNWYAFGNAYDRLDREPQAVEAYNRALAQSPNFAEAYNNRGAAQQKLGRYGAALADYRRAAELGDSLGSRNAAALRQASSGGRGSFPNSTNAAINLANGIHDQQITRYMTDHPGATHQDASEAVNSGMQ
jgi:tetratricopeptide (TPR) repeat protein